MPILKAQSSIKISDDLQEESSYYFNEVNVIKKMVDSISDTCTNLFVIDEIFKGTNTVERISLSKAVLQYLSCSNNIVVASSHDIELVSLLHGKFKYLHFTESVKDDRLSFDFLIKEGPLKTRNAIKIIEIADYPFDIISEANTTASGLSKRDVEIN